MILNVILYAVAPATAILGVWVLIRTSHFVRDTFLRTPETEHDESEERKE